MANVLNSRNNIIYSSTNLSDVINPYDIDTIYCTYDDVSNDFSRFLRVIDVLLERKINEINVDSFETAKYINDHLMYSIPLNVYILDDFENKMRNYDMNVFDKITVSIPITQLLWNVDFDDSCYVNLTQHSNNAMSYNGNYKISKENLIMIKEIIKSLNKKELSDLEKIVLVSNYLQRNVEYISYDMDTTNVKHTFDNEVDFKEIESRAGLIETVLLKNYGLCTGIASATTILLNNPQMNLNVRNVASLNHMWNIVKFNGVYYQIDNTISITCSPKEIKKAIKPVRFNDRFLVFGQDYSDILANHQIVTDIKGNMSAKSLRKKYINKAINNLSKTESFIYSEENYVYPLTKHFK